MGLPLAGVRIIDSTTMIAIPYAMALMADMGAEVIKVDNHTAPASPAAIYPDNKPGKRHWDQDGNHHTLDRNKLGIALDLKRPEAVELFKELIRVSDVLVENNRPGTMQRLGLDYEELKKIKPDIIMLSNTGFGHSGPWRSYPGVGRMMELTSGLSQFTGYPDQGPRRIGYAFFDPHVGWLGIFAVLAALLYRQRTGRGQWIDLSMYQVGTATLGDAILDYMTNGRSGHPMGNRHPFIAPHGVYPCRGEDSWIAISVETDEQWQKLCEIMGDPDLTQREEFAGNFGRWRYQDELDKHIGGWTRGYDHYDLMHQLQGAGILAGPVLNSKEVLTDPHLKARGFFERVSHPEKSGLGTRLYIGRPWKMSKAPCSILKPAPDVGEHNQHVLGKLLGLDETALARLYAIGAIGEELINARQPAEPISWETQLERGIIAGHDPDYKSILGLA